MNSSTKRSFALGLFGLAFLASGCASQKTLKEYQDEVRALREERTQLKKENRGLRMQSESYEIALAEANAARPAETSDVPNYSEFDDRGIDYYTKDGNFVISLPASITFDSGKADLTKQGQEALKVVAQTLSTDYADSEYWIEGHTDSDPIRKSKWGSNRELSMARAMAVLFYLVEQCEVPDESFVVAGHGEYEPLAENVDSASKARNRRVEIVVHRPRI